jgi:hypothetical protein
MRRINLLGIAAVALSIQGTCISVQGRQDDDEGIHASFRNDVIQANLDGTTGEMRRKCETCKRWHSWTLQYKKTITFNKSGFRGAVYKVEGLNRWYFFGEDELVDGQGKGRYPLYLSTAGSGKDFYRIRRTGGTKRIDSATYTVPTSAKEEGAIIEEIPLEGKDDPK